MCKESFFWMDGEWMDGEWMDGEWMTWMKFIGTPNLWL